MLANLQGVTMLTTGDLCGEYELYAMARADILKVPHHGSANSSSREFLEGVAADVLLLSAGRQSRETGFAERITGGTLYSTVSQGAITVTFTGNGTYTVQPWLTQEQ